MGNKMKFKFPNEKPIFAEAGAGVNEAGRAGVCGTKGASFREADKVEACR